MGSYIFIKILIFINQIVTTTLYWIFSGYNRNMLTQRIIKMKQDSYMFNELGVKRNERLLWSLLVRGLPRGSW